jgi:hypothetical protein
MRPIRTIKGPAKIFDDPRENLEKKTKKYFVHLPRSPKSINYVCCKRREIDNKRSIVVELYLSPTALKQSPLPPFLLFSYIKRSQGGELSMARIYHVKKARKTKKKYGIKAGKPYWYSKVRRNGRFCTLYFTSPPKPSQIMSPGFWRTITEIKEGLPIEIQEGDFEALNMAIQEVTSALEELRDETQSSWDNLPESFQSSSQGDLLQERINAVEAVLEKIPSEVDDDSEDLDSELNELVQALEEIDCE